MNGIYVSKVGGNYASHLMKDTSDHPRAISVDPREGQLFWTDWGLEAFIGEVKLDLLLIQ